MSQVEISEASTLTPELLAAFERLVPQLSSSSPPPTAAELRTVVESPSTLVLLARDPDRAADAQIIGSLTLVLFRIPTGLRARIEDVVVDESARGRGVGELLSRSAIDRARAEGARTVDLTSRPSREAANRLYQRMGFVERESNIYRFEIGDPD